MSVDWVTISSLATAGGTLILAVATFASVRSGNRTAQAAERSLLAGLRPLLIPTRPDDPPEKIRFADDKWVVAKGGRAVAELFEGNLYLAFSLRNAGNGIAVLHGWRYAGPSGPVSDEHRSTEGFRRLSRDLYVPAGDIAFA